MLQSIILSPIGRLYLVVLLIGIKNHIEEVDNGSVIADILLVVEVMVRSTCTEGQNLGLSPRPVVPGVSVAGFEHAHGDPDQNSEDVDGIDL